MFCFEEFIKKKKKNLVISGCKLMHYSAWALGTFIYFDIDKMPLLHILECYFLSLLCHTLSL